ncbi:MAG: S9 family peptidase [Bacillota bacterium]
MRSAHCPSFSPAGDRLAFLTNITGVPQVWEVTAPGAWPEQLTFFSERVASLAYSPVKDFLLFAMDTGGNERTQLYLMAENAGRLTRITRDDEVIHTPGPWSPGGGRLAYAANGRHPAHFDVYVHDLETGSSLVYQADGLNLPVAWSADEGQLVIARSVSNLAHQLHLLDLATGSVRPLTPGIDDATFSAVCWPQPGCLYVATNYQEEFVYLATLDPATGEIQPLLKPDWDVENLVFSRHGRVAAYTVNREGSSDLYLWWPKTGESRRMAAEPGTIADLAWSPAGDRLAYTFSGPRDNPNIWVLDLATGRVDSWTRSSRAGIPRELLVEPSLVHFPTFDGRQIPAWHYRPPGAARRPVVVDVHGGPEGQERPDFNPIAQYLVHSGYEVFLPNVRGSAGYGRTYLALDDVRLRMDAVRDLEAGARWLLASGAGKLAVMGGSYGGFMVLAALTTSSELWSAGVDLVGIANFETFLENTGPWRRKLREAEYGSLEHDREFLRQISPIHRVDQIQAPLMVIHGANDPRVPVGEAEQIVAGLQSLGRPVSYLRFDDEGHGIVKLPNRIRAFTEMVSFLDQYLK